MSPTSKPTKQSITMRKPFWNPAYKKPLAFGFGVGFLSMLGLFLAVKSIAPTEDAKLVRGWQVTGKYVSDTSLGRRNGWVTKIGDEYVICVGSAYGGKTDCPKAHEGRKVTATRVSMPSFTNQQLVIAELREGSDLLYTRSDSELTEGWRLHSYAISGFLSFFAGMVIGVAFAIPLTFKPSVKNRNGLRE